MEDADGIVEALSIPIAAGLAHDPMDSRIQLFASGMGDVWGRRVDHAVPVGLDQPSRALDRLRA